MAQTVFQGASFKVTHTLEQEGPHLTRNDAYYDEALAMTVLLQGSGTCFVEGSRYPMVPGDLVLMRADELRRCRFAQDGVHERLSIYLQPSFADALQELPLLQVFRNRAPGIGNKIRLREDDSAGWRTLLEIQDWMATFRGSSGELAQAELQLLILRLLIRLCRIRESAADDEPRSGDPAMENVCRYILEHLTETLTYQHIQEHCHVNRYQLGEVFRRSTGMTLTEYIISKRLLQAAELVRGGAGIETAAAAAGFQTYSHFYKAFVRQKGMSPRQYFQKTLR